jgi:hypothetical protein
MRDRRVVLLAPVLALTTATGCSKPKVKHLLALSDAPRTVEIRVAVNGTELAPVRVWRPDQVQQVELGTFEQPPAIAVRALLPCGWVEVAVKPVGGTEAEQRHLARVLDAKTLLGVWVDNRNGAAFKASFGQLEIPIAAGFTGSFQVPAPTCAEAKLRVGDAELTTPQASELVQGRVPAYLIDGSASRCYRTHVVRYAPGGGVSLEPPSDERLGPARFHALAGKVDDFLKPAPETVPIKLGEGFPSRRQLTEEPCAAEPR